jgi:hypothetical protein
MVCSNLMEVILGFEKTSATYRRLADEKSLAADQERQFRHGQRTFAHRSPPGKTADLLATMRKL